MKKIIALLFVTFLLASCYPAQSEKARDTTRVTDLQNIRVSLEQVYQDEMEYPSSLNDANLAFYLPNWAPKDPKEWELINGCTMGYKYEVSTTDIENDTFRLSTCFENKWNIEVKAMNDWWIYSDKYEVFWTWY